MASLMVAGIAYFAADSLSYFVKGQSQLGVKAQIADFGRAVRDNATAAALGKSYDARGTNNMANTGICLGKTTGTCSSTTTETFVMLPSTGGSATDAIGGTSSARVLYNRSGTKLTSSTGAEFEVLTSVSYGCSSGTCAADTQAEFAKITYEVRCLVCSPSTPAEQKIAGLVTTDANGKISGGDVFVNLRTPAAQVSSSGTGNGTPSGAVNVTGVWNYSGTSEILSEASVNAGTRLTEPAPCDSLSQGCYPVNSGGWGD